MLDFFFTKLLQDLKVVCFFNKYIMVENEEARESLSQYDL